MAMKENVDDDPGKDDSLQSKANARKAKSEPIIDVVESRSA